MHQHPRDFNSCQKSMHHPTIPNQFAQSHHAMWIVPAEPRGLEMQAHRRPDMEQFKAIHPWSVPKAPHIGYDHISARWICTNQQIWRPHDKQRLWWQHCQDHCRGFDCEDWHTSSTCPYKKQGHQDSSHAQITGSTNTNKWGTHFARKGCTRWWTHRPEGVGRWR